MRFSVLVPVYNVERYLVQCLNSIKEQSFADFEVIIVDDGSTDGSEKICDEFAESDDRFVVVHQSNHGITFTRRIAISKASGEYCVFVDSDDYLSGNALEIIDHYIERKSSDIVLYNSYLLFENSNKSIKKRVSLFDDEEEFVTEKQKQKLYFQLLTNDSMNALWQKAIRTSLLKNDPTDYDRYMDVSLGEDFIMSCHPVFSAAKVIYIEQYLYYYRQSDTGVTRFFEDTSLEKEFSRFPCQLYEIRMYYAKKCGNNEVLEREIEKRTAISLVKYFFKGISGCKSTTSKKLWIEKDWARQVSNEILDDYKAGRIKIGFAYSLYFDAIMNHRIFKISLLEIARKSYHAVKALLLPKQ